jgi:DMSO reductase anchor subunit
MRPTFSIILFTVLSGAGYGLLFLLGLDLMLGAPTDIVLVPRVNAVAVPVDPRFGLGAALATGFVLTSIGLLASVAHLGQPLRAWRAFSQWRSSWLSREGIAALATYVPVAAIAFFLFTQSEAHAILRLLGLLLALCSVATVSCTARIYSSLPPIRAWHNRYTLPAYLLLGLYSGALCFVAVHGATRGQAGLWSATLGVFLGSTILGPGCALLKFKYWRHIDASASSPGAGTATGLDRLGDVRSFEQPHTEENYLTHEMGFVLARKHARRLRAIAFWLILLAPSATVPLAWLVGAPGFWLALILGMTGIFVERWLFFAEAKHAVMAYYGR